MEYNFDQQLDEFSEQMDLYRQQGLRMFSTSSFQPQSIVLLHMISQVDTAVPIYFLNTGYHFPETIRYREQVQELMGLDIRDISSEIPSHRQTGRDGQPLHQCDPEHCCHLNKVMPLEKVLKKYDVWINGVRRTQTAHRAVMDKEGKAKHGVLRYHPLIEWDAKMVYTYINYFELPLHPLLREGYFSVGCQPCTAKPGSGTDVDDRSGRWAGSGKTECGLHTSL